MSTNVFRALFICGATALASRADFFPIAFDDFHNSRMQTYRGQAPQYPEGDVVLGGVPFSIPKGGDNVWNASIQEPGTDPAEIEIGMGRYAVRRVHTLINCWWGETTQGTYAALEFRGSKGAFYRWEMDGNDDIRDYWFNDFANNINGVTTVNVFKAGNGMFDEVRLDMQTIELPAEFRSQSLTSVRVIDTGRVNFQRVFVAGVTVDVVPEPSALLAASILGALGLRRRF